jgi:hypothetical protein
VAKENAFKDRVRRLVVEFGPAERPVPVDLILCLLGRVVMIKQDGRVHEWVASERMMRYVCRGWLGAAQDCAGQWVRLFHLFQRGDIVAERQ